jgi:hypothetical protein
MDDVQSNEAISNTVELVEACGEWFVHVVEDGKEASVSFENEAFALAYAEGQRIRLGLRKVARI